MAETATAAAADKQPEEETKNETVKDVEASEDKEVKKEDTIYDADIPPRIIVGRTHPLSFYVDRARRVFRIEDEVHIQGRGDNIATTCKLVETLKRQKIADITKISTGMNIESYFTAQGDAKWGQPVAIIVFTLKRGEFGKYIADYQQRKVIEVFEKEDATQTGILAADKVEALDMGTAFKATEEQVAEAKKYLASVDKSVDLPTFIKYASILIHPLLKAKVFKEALNTSFGLDVGGGGAKKDDDDMDDIEWMNCAVKKI